MQFNLVTSLFSKKGQTSLIMDCPVNNLIVDKTKKMTVKMSIGVKKKKQSFQWSPDEIKILIKNCNLAETIT